MAPARRQSAPPGRTTLPFVLTALAALALLPAAGHVHVGLAFAAAAVLVLGLGLLRLAGADDRPLAVCAVGLVFVALLRHAAGGSDSGYGVLVLVPVVWVAMHGRAGEVWTALAGAAITLLAPLVLLGSPEYPPSAWRGGPVLLLCCALAGRAIHGALRRSDAATDERRRLQDSIADGVIVVDRHGTVTEVNAALCALTGFAAEEIVGRRAPLPSWPVEDHDQLLRRHRDAIAAGGGTFDARLVRRDGREIRVSIAVGVVASGTGERTVVATVKDITERVRLERRLEIERDRFAAIGEAMHDGFGVTRDGVIVEVNQAMCDITGFTREQLLGARQPFPFWPPELREDLLGVAQRIREAHGGVLELVFQRADGTRFDAEATTVELRDEHGEVEGFLNTIRDVSDRKRRERAARERARQTALTADVVRRLGSAEPEALPELVCRLARTAAGADDATLWERTEDGSRLRRAWPAAGRRAGDAAAPPDVDGAAEQLGPWVPGGDTVGLAAPGAGASLWLQPIVSQATHWVLALGWAAPGVALADGQRDLLDLIGQEAMGALQRAAALDELALLARTDALTGLVNRRALEERLADLSAISAQPTLAMIDLDHFKAFNDANGHLAGDRLLRDVSAAWTRRVRSGDLLARWGGEEFCLLLDCDLEQARHLLEQMRDSVPDDQTFSAGLAQAAGPWRAVDLVAAADEALYRAKAAGRDRTELATDRRVRPSVR